MHGTLERCERDVEAARARLAGDLQVLRQPETVQSFTRAIKIELMTAKDAALESAKTSAFGAMNDAINKMKSKAAANPAALLAIGAGLAWHFVRNPPIVTALVGAGLVSLLKTSAPAVPPQDIITHGRERLKEQVGEFADLAKATTQSASESLSQKVSDLSRSGAEAASDAAQTITAQVSQATGHLTDRVKQHADQVAEQIAQATTRGVDAAGDIAANVRRDVSDSIDESVGAVTGAVRQAVADAPKLVPDAPRAQDAVLLGIAGIAVAAALGLALQRTSQES